MKNTNTLIAMFKASQQPLTPAQESTLAGAMAFMDSVQEAKLLKLDHDWMQAIGQLVGNKDPEPVEAMARAAIRRQLMSNLGGDHEN